MANESYYNELIHETSPYLLQHANNPVHWLPWGERALCRARGTGCIVESQDREQVADHINWIFRLSLVSCNGA